MKAWPKVRLGDVLRQRKPSVVVDRSATYQFAGVFCFGRGVFRGQQKHGSEFAYEILNRVRAGEFIYPKLMAWEGAFGVVPTNCHGCYVSPEFPVFELDEARLDSRFLSFYFQIPRVWEEVSGGSTGTNVRRRRLNPTDFIEREIPLPPLAEQQRVVARIEEVAAQIHEARSLRAQAAGEVDSLSSHIAADLFPAAANESVRDFVRFQTGYAFKSEWFSEDGVRLARNANVGHGHLDWSETVRIPAERRHEFARFELGVGDVLVALDRPIISTGVKVARVTESDLPSLLLQRVARAQFHDDRVLPDYFFRWLRSPYFVGAIDPGRSNGVPHISHKDIEKIPFAAPPLAEQRRIVAELDALQAEVDALKRLQAETATELDALLPAILDRAFKGELT